MNPPDLLNGARSPADIFINAIISQTKVGLDLPYALSYSPVSQLNPFQKLLYCNAASAGYALIPTARFHNLGQVNWSKKSVIHLHWVASVLKRCTSKREAEFCVAQFETQMMQWRSRGHKLLWTIHNVLPHDHIFFASEISLRKAIVRQCDAVHILSEESVSKANEFFTIPEEKVFHIPHPSYEGWYPNILDRSTARQYLGLDSGEFTFLTFGALQRYKGIQELIHTFKSLEKKYANRSLRLVIAGKPTDVDYVGELTEAIGDAVTITLIRNTIEDKDVQVLFKAADVVVAPYTNTLNSGVALLAATFKRNFVAPHAPGITETYLNDSTLLYTNQIGDKLADALERSLHYKLADKQYTEILKLYRPMTISKEFFTAVTARLFDKEIDAQNEEMQGGSPR